MKMVKEGDDSKSPNGFTLTLPNLASYDTQPVLILINCLGNHFWFCN